MQFKDVIGQDAVKLKLASMAASGKIPHALMLLGPEGNGNLALALALAQYVQCTQKTEADSCGTCASCVRNQKFIHPDVHFTYPVIKGEKMKSPPVSADYISEWRSALTANPYMSYNDWLQNIGAENKQGNITAEECRAVIHNLSLKTYEDGYKIQIIWLAEYLGYEGNILLKILEEPPANTLFVLIVENTELMLNTILSRAQLIKVPPIADEDIQQALLTRFETDENAAKRLARISDGNFNAALNYAQGEESANDKLLRNWLLACFNLKQKNSGSNVAALQDWIEDTAKIGRENQKIFLKYALFFLRECSLLSALGKSEKLEGEELMFATKLTARLNPEQLSTLAKIFTDLHYHIERNGNPKILFASNSFKIASVFVNQEVEAELL